MASVTKAASLRIPGRRKKMILKQKMKLFRANEPLLSVFMWGVNHSISELSHVTVPVMLLPDDFKAFSKTRVDNHFFNKENMPSHFKFKEYCPLVFRNLRERFTIDDQDYMNSLTRSEPLDTDSPGRSGARFLHSCDHLYVIKTLVSEEVEQMHHILKNYHQYIVERHADTLLPQYLGMYRITVNDTESYMVVMRNVFSPRLTVHKKFDLKGSTVDRDASDKEKAKDLPTFKDNDFVREGVSLFIGEENKKKLIETLTADAEFLSSLNLMDYSLLVGIHDVDKAELENQEEMDDENGVGPTDSDDSTGSGCGGQGGALCDVPTPPDSPRMVAVNFESEMDPKLELFGLKSTPESPRREIYFLALIDMLTRYGLKKRTAAAAKTVKHGAGAEISTVKPEQYAKRFIEFINKILQ